MLVAVALAIFLMFSVPGLPSWLGPMRAWVFGAAATIAIVFPELLRTHHPFAAEFDAVDSQVARELKQAERDWRSGRIDDTTYSAAFDRANVRYRALKPPNAEWRAIVGERIRLREEWSLIFASHDDVPTTEYERLRTKERRLKGRIARASR